ncbi:MAG: Gfo/Idh/MocA family protein [Hyphomicrobiaceae bacterium]
MSISIEAPARIRLGMVGGGQGAFIGAVHRLAARMDDQFTLVAGALSSSPEKARASAAELGLAPDRGYASWAEMLAAEAKRTDGMQAVAIVTPNSSHFAIAKAALEAGFHVICDKPLTTTSADARALVDIVERSGRVFVLTHNYTGYPMIRQARAMVGGGQLGEIRVVQAEYPQAWLTESLEATGQKQASWRTDPAQSGAGGCIGDIGTHAFNLACFVTGLSPEAVLAELTTFVAGRRLDDNAHVLVRFASGARGMLWASQVAPGNENGLRLRVYGSKGGLAWAQEDPNYLWVTLLGQPTVRYTRGGDGALPEAARVTRTPFGHPEGYLEGFANIYQEAARAIRAHAEQQAAAPDVLYPTVHDGWLGVRFIEATVESSARGNVWVAL